MLLWQTAPHEWFTSSASELAMTTGTSQPPIDTGRPQSARVYDALLGRHFLYS